ncbi:MAG TPA: hypothetical protein VG148_15595, partial [Pyrinomonadaceae bacterium]|nr:hypothetical protein [Pyrinomonadaceae bacterium]
MLDERAAAFLVSARLLFPSPRGPVNRDDVKKFRVSSFEFRVKGNFFLAKRQGRSRELETRNS